MHHDSLFNDSESILSLPSHHPIKKKLPKEPSIKGTVDAVCFSGQQRSCESVFVFVHGISVTNVKKKKKKKGKMKSKCMWYFSKLNDPSRIIAWKCIMSVPSASSQRAPRGVASPSIQPYRLRTGGGSPLVEIVIAFPSVEITFPPGEAPPHRRVLRIVLTPPFRVDEKHLENTSVDGEHFKTKTAFSNVSGLM